MISFIDENRGVFGVEPLFRLLCSLRELNPAHPYSIYGCIAQIKLWTFR